MRFFYPLVSGILALLALPLLPLLAAKQKYRRLFQRLGFGLHRHLARSLPPTAQPICWIHALSVGEITSALPLVRGLRQTMPVAGIVVSATTRAGGEVARRLLTPYADAVIAAPLDLGPIVPLFIHAIRPNLFILVETDFWPHWLHSLARRNIPTVLVNGRISARSFGRYHRFAPICRPMFRRFSLLAMQTETDAAQMKALGVDPSRVVTLGNLKFDTSHLRPEVDLQAIIALEKERYGFQAAQPLWICGSTHRGEEALIFRAYRRLLATIPDLQLLLAPRNIERAEEIIALGQEQELCCRRWSRDQHSQSGLLVLDTIGELAACYAMADAVFVGGSLVDEGGHNPLEPASASVPVLFGPHMEDFAEIAWELVECGGARQMTSEETLVTALHQILNDRTIHRTMAEAASAYVTAHRGVVDRHLAAIATLLHITATSG